jgi:hypothetical protein
VTDGPDSREALASKKFWSPYPPTLSHICGDKGEKFNNHRRVPKFVIGS